MGRLSQSRSLVSGAAQGEILRFDRPISLWGGVNPEDGTVSDPRHPQFGEALGARILVLEETVGSSSSSAIMLELMRNGTAPAGVVLGNADAILVLGVVVGVEMGYPGLPVVEVGIEIQNIPAIGRIQIKDEIVSWD